MSEDNAANSAPIPDQIAQGFLRDRDVQCPRCHYSMRGGSSSTCPECGCAFALAPFDPQRPDQHQKLIRFAILFLALLALAEVVGRGVTLVWVMLINVIPFSTVFRTSYIVELVVWFALFVYLVVQWRSSRRGWAKSNKTVMVPAIIVFLVYTVPMGIQIATMLFTI